MRDGADVGKFFHLGAMRWTWLYGKSIIKVLVEQIREIIWGSLRPVNWDRFWELEPEWLIVWLAVLAMLIAVAAYGISKIRAKTLQREPIASELLSKFRDWHSKGELTDEEFRTIKTMLAAQLQQEVKKNDRAG